MKKTIIFLLLLVTIQLTCSQLDDILQLVHNRYAVINTFEAVLLQENYWSEIQMTREATGKIYYNSDSLHISYQPPDAQQLYILDNTLIVYDVDSKQAIYMDKEDFFIKPLEIIDEYWQQSEKQVLSQKGKHYELLLKKEEETLQIKIDDGLIKEVMVADPDSNMVKYKFEQEKINQSLPSGIFTLDLPYETNIIDNRNKGE